MNRFTRRTVLEGLATTGLATTGLVAPFVSRAAHAAAATFALVTINEQALFFNQLNDGAKRAAAKAGVNLVIYNPNNNPTAQNNAIDDYIQQKVQGIIVDAIDVNGIMPAVQKASAADIPVVAVDAILPPGPQKSQIGVDNEGGGGTIGRYFADYVQKEMGGKTSLGIVGALNSFIQNLRQKGFQDAIKSDPGITLAQVVDGRNIQDNAMSVSETLLTGNPELTSIYATGEPALIGAIAAVQSENRTKTIKIVGWDLSAQAIAGLDAGFVVAVVQQDPVLLGGAAVDALVAVRAGEPVVKRINTKLTIVTKENVGPYRKMFS